MMKRKFLISAVILSVEYFIRQRNLPKTVLRTKKPIRVFVDVADDRTVALIA
jgi:hypothetical protein